MIANSKDIMQHQQADYLASFDTFLSTNSFISFPNNQRDPQNDHTALFLLYCVLASSQDDNRTAFQFKGTGSASVQTANKPSVIMKSCCLCMLIPKSRRAVSTPLVWLVGKPCCGHKKLLGWWPWQHLEKFEQCGCYITAFLYRKYISIGTSIGIADGQTVAACFVHSSGYALADALLWQMFVSKEDLL